MFSLGLLVYGLTQYDWHDFDVFYTAAQAALNGKSIYITVGQYNLPFWYFPWTAWFYIPFSLWPYRIGLILYQTATVACAILVVTKLTNFHRPNFQFIDTLLIYTLILPMSAQLMQVGQMDYILLGLIAMVMFAIDQKREILAGGLIPFLWIKPHLLIVFTLFALWRGGRRTVLISLILSGAMLLVETAISPDWVGEMLDLLRAGSQRTHGLQFTTFPNMLGFQENWVGTANLPFTVPLIIIAILITWRYRSLPTIPLLSLALAASLFCAPRAYAYDLPLLIPPLIWLTAKDFKKHIWLWILAAAIPFLSGFASISYLVIALVFLLSIFKAHQASSQKTESIP